MAVKAREEQKRHMEEAKRNNIRKGCNCKKNYCHKGYCICHNSGQHCDRNLCHCQQCYNYEGAPPLPGSNGSDSGKPSETKKRRKQE